MEAVISALPRFADPSGAFEKERVPATAPQHRPDRKPCRARADDHVGGSRRHSTPTREPASNCKSTVISTLPRIAWQTGHSRSACCTRLRTLGSEEHTSELQSHHDLVCRL